MDANILNIALTQLCTNYKTKQAPEEESDNGLSYFWSFLGHQNSIFAFLLFVFLIFIVRSNSWSRWHDDNVKVLRSAWHFFWPKKEYHVIGDLFAPIVGWCIYGIAILYIVDTLFHDLVRWESLFQWALTLAIIGMTGTGSLMVSNMWERISVSVSYTFCEGDVVIIAHGIKGTVKEISQQYVLIESISEETGAKQFAYVPPKQIVENVVTVLHSKSKRISRQNSRSSGTGMDDHDENYWSILMQDVRSHYFCVQMSKGFMWTREFFLAVKCWFKDLFHAMHMWIQEKVQSTNRCLAKMCRAVQAIVHAWNPFARCKNSTPTSTANSQTVSHGACEPHAPSPRSSKSSRSLEFLPSNSDNLKNAIATGSRSVSRPRSRSTSRISIEAANIINTPVSEPSSGKRVQVAKTASSAVSSGPNTRGRTRTPA